MAQENPSEAQLVELQEQLKILNKQLHRKTSFRYLFSFAVVQGIGYAIGATIIASIIVAMTARLLMTIDYVPLLNQFFSSQELQDTISNEIFTGQGGPR